MYLPRVRVITNSKFVCKHFGNTSLCWNLDEFMRRKWMFFMFSATEAADLYRLLHMIDATLEYSSSIDETVKIFYENVSGKMPFGNITAGLSASDISVVASPVKDLTIQKQGKPEKGSVAQGLSVGSSTTNSISKSTPVVYTCGVLHSKVVNEKKYVEAGIGVYWPYCHEMGTGKRYTFYPITLVRCQLQAIIEALQQAIDQNYSSIILRTDCTSFLVHHSRQWIKTNGSYVRYHDQYLRIVDLCKNIKVKFLSASDRAAMSEAETLAENGICLPLPAKKSRKYSNPINVNFSDKRDV
ncbi:unnamed protein product [Thelazia callipaeda]|uniref:RNase H domain-containing protein n=1 Tax=Thelazia callipaeda TaxID=103827 RepID=A0A158RCL1_THECL|nr:unnamed protein product [Thelazia callipaeda]